MKLSVLLLWAPALSVGAAPVIISSADSASGLEQPDGFKIKVTPALSEPHCLATQVCFGVVVKGVPLGFALAPVPACRGV